MYSGKLTADHLKEGPLIDPVLWLLDEVGGGDTPCVSTAAFSRATTCAVAAVSSQSPSTFPLATISYGFLFISCFLG